MTDATSNPTSSAPTPEQLADADAAAAQLAAMEAQGDVNQANAVTGVYGDSGTGKSALCATAVEYCWTRYHKISRYVTADLGGFGNKLLRLIRLGICQVYNPLNHLEPFEAMEDLSLGYWPEKIDDIYTGLAAPDVKLIPPQSTHWTVYCQAGHPVRTVRVKSSLNGFSLQCPECKTVVTPLNWGRVEELTVRDPWIEHVGLWIMDSATAIEDHIMDDMGSKAAKNDPTIKDGNSLSNTGARVNSGKYSFGANTQQHYGFAQNRCRGWIKNSRTIPGQVLPAIYTFLELRATDDTKNIAIYGPKIAGNAKTSDVPSWLGNCLHTTKERNQQGIEVHRLYLVNHTDPGQNIPHLAKTRAEPGTLPPFLEDKADEPTFTRFSLGYFFDQLEQALDPAKDAKLFQDAPLFKPLVVGAEPTVIGRRDLSGGETGVGRGTAVARPSVPQAVQTMARPAVVGPRVVGAPAAPVQTHTATVSVGGPAVRPTATVAVAPAPAPPKPAPVATPAPTTAIPAGAPRAAAPAPAGSAAPPAPPKPPTPPAVGPTRPVVRPIGAGGSGSGIGTPPPPGGKKP